MRRTLLLAGLLLFQATPAVAQRSQVAIEASFFRGAVGYARQVGEGLYAGAEIGFGFPQIDRTVVPDEGSAGDPDFKEFLHLALFMRAAHSEGLELDAGLRASVASLWSCGASDCWPARFLGAYLQPMFGWRRLKFGPRLTIGWIDEARPGTTDGGTTVVGLSPFAVRLTFPW